MDRPFIFINSAMSADGKLSTKERKQVRISGKLDFGRVDELRAQADAVMVGIGTVLSDDPSLTVKSPERKAARKAAGKSENPVRIIVDSAARTPLDADIFKKGEGFLEAEMLDLELLSVEKIEEGVLLKWKVKGKRK